MQNIAFFGLGNMGASMATNLLAANFNVSVFDLVPEQISLLVKKGARGARSVQDAILDANVIVSMLPAGKHVSQLYNEILPHISKNSLLIDCSTIDANDAKSFHDLVSARGHRFVDAPVSGGVAGAKAGTLTFIMGGIQENIEKAKPVLRAMGQHCFHAGGPGAGQIAKICNNMLLAVLMTGTSEALKLAIDNGLDPATMSQIMQLSSGNNWTLQNYNPVPGIMPNTPASNDYKGGFMVDLMNKDLGLAMSAANNSGSATPMGSLARSLYQLHAIQGNGEKDFSSIFEAFTKNNELI